MATRDGRAIEPGVAPPEPPSEASASEGLADRRITDGWTAIWVGERDPNVLRGLLENVLKAHAEAFTTRTPTPITNAEDE